MAMSDTAANYYLLLAALALLLVIWMQAAKGSKKHRHKQKNIKISKKQDAHGIIFGLYKGKSKVMYSPVNGEEHVLTCAGTGKGKTSSILIPTLRSWQGVSLSIDISGDISKNCPDMPCKIVFEPEDENTIPYDVFAAIDAVEDRDKQDEMLEELAILLIPEPPNIGSNAKYFADGGRKILTGVLIYGYHKGADFCRICQNLVSTAWQNMFSEILQGDDEKAKMYLSSFVGSNEQNTAGCYQNAADSVALFATNRNIFNSVHRPKDGEKAVTPPLIENSNIFIIVQDEKLELYAPLLNIIISQFMQYISSRTIKEGSRKILLTLDEFASLGIDSQTILAALRKYRKKLCRVMVLTQSIADINLLYGDDCTRALLANFRFKVLLGGLGDLESLEMFAKLIGYKRIKKQSISRSAKTVSRTESDDKEYIIEPADLDRLGDKAILIGEEGHYILDKNFYYKN